VTRLWELTDSWVTGSVRASHSAILPLCHSAFPPIPPAVPLEVAQSLGQPLVH